MTLIKELTGARAEFAHIRRELRSYADLRDAATRTADLVASILQSWGIPVHRGIGGTGVVGVIRSMDDDAADYPGGLKQENAGRENISARAIGLRADLDSAPVRALAESSHGAAHSCSAALPSPPSSSRTRRCDGNAAMLLAAAWHLNATRRFSGSIYLIFQPAVPVHDGSGAARMIADGLFDRFAMDAVYAIGSRTDLPPGAFAVSTNTRELSGCTFGITLRRATNRPAAGAPQHAVDPVSALTTLSQALQNILAHKTRQAGMADIARTAAGDADTPATLAISSLHAGDCVPCHDGIGWLRGVIHAPSQEVMHLLETRVRAMTQHLMPALGCQAEFVFERSYPAIVNHPAHAALCVETMHAVAGAQNVIEDATVPVDGDDFSLMLRCKPGCHAWIGSGAALTATDADNDFDDALLPVGASYWVRLAERALAQGGGSHASSDSTKDTSKNDELQYV